MMLIDVLKYTFLFLAIWFTIINTSLVCMRDGIPFVNFLFQAVSVTGFVIVQWLI